MVTLADEDMNDAEIVWEDGPAGSSDGIIASHSRRQLAIDTEIVLADGPDGSNEKRMRTPTRRPPSKRRAATGGMFMDDDEPATKKNIIDEPDDDVDIDALVFAHPGVGALLPGNDGCQNEAE